MIQCYFVSFSCIKIHFSSRLSSFHLICIEYSFIALFFKPRHFLNADKMRWSLAAHDICFTKDWHGKGFSLGKCVPIVRGLGVQQRAVDFVIDRLNHSGDWLHIFPEGKINMERNEIQRLKWGVGRIISECRTKPIVIPFWHTGKLLINKFVNSFL